MKTFQKLMAVGVLAILSSIITAPSALAISITEPVNIDINGADHIDITSDTETGDIYLVAAQLEGDSSDGITFYKYDSVGAAWGGDILISDTESISSYSSLPKIDVSPSGYIGVVWTSSVGETEYATLKFAESRDEGLNFNIYTIDDSVTSAHHPDFKYKSDDTPLIASLTSNGLEVTKLTWTGGTYPTGDYADSSYSITSGGSNFKDVEMQLFSNEAEVLDEVHIIGAPNIDNPSDTVNYYKGIDNGTDTGDDITWIVSDELVMNGINNTGHHCSIRSALNDSGEMRIVILDDEETNDRIIYASRDSEGTWNSETVYTNTESDMVDSVPYIAHSNGIDYITVNSTEGGNNAYLYSSIDNYATHDFNHFFAADGGGIDAYIISTIGAWVNHGTAHSGGIIYTAIAPLTGDEMVMVTTEGSSNDMPTCTGTASIDGDAYSAVPQIYEYDGIQYNFQAYVYGTSVSQEDVGVHFVFGDSSADISCVHQNTTDRNWHLALVELTSEGMKIVTYFAAEDYSGLTESEVKTSMELYLDQIFEGMPYTIDFIKLDALEYSGTPNDVSAAYDLIVDDPGDGYTLTGVGYGIADSATWVLGAGTPSSVLPDIDIIPGTGTGEPVPEFKDYILILTIALALGLAYTVIPKTQPAKA